MEIVNYCVPFDIFTQWFEKAKSKKEIIEPTAMCLSTVKNNTPSSRMVLLKHFDESGFCFYTNLTSNKAEQLSMNKNVSLCFYWGSLGYQVRIEGHAIGVTKKEADDYFASRRRESQIGAWASKQSREMQNEDEFQNRIKEIEKKFFNKDVPRPDFWSGFRVVANRIEFWEEKDFRLHTRNLFILQDNKTWAKSRIYP